MRFPVVKLLDFAGREEELVASDNAAAQIVLAHLEARAAREQPESRRAAKTRLVKRLYGRGWSPDDVRQLFRLIDWLLELPGELRFLSHPRAGMVFISVSRYKMGSRRLIRQLS